MRTFRRLASACVPAGWRREVALDDLIAHAREANQQALSLRERVATGAVASVAATGAVLIAVLDGSSREVHPVTVAALVGAYAIASRVEFEIGNGSFVPTQVVFIPMLVLLPAGLVAPAVLGALLIAGMLDVARRGRHLERLVLVLPSITFALGGAAVVGAAGEPALSWDSAWVYACAIGASAVVDLVTALAHQLVAVGLPPGRMLRMMGEIYLVDVTLAPVGLAFAHGAADSPITVLGSLPFVALLGWFAQERRRRVDKALELSRAYRGTALLLGDVIEADDAYTGSHSRDVVDLVLAVADVLELDADDRQRAEFTALLHDVGKIRVPSEIIHKPGPLTPAERVIMDRHTVEGEAILATVGGLLGEVGTLVRACHERWDGKGYPDGLLAEQIPLIARIVCCCDAYNAMTTDRSYRRALPLDQAVAELRASAGTHFDPSVVRALLEVVGEDANTKRLSLAA